MLHQNVLIKIGLVSLIVTASALAQSSNGVSAMQRSREMRSDLQAGDARQLTTLSRYQQQTGNQPRVIHAPALHGQASLIAREPALTQRHDSVMQPVNFQQHGSDDREFSNNHGSNAYRSVHVGGRHDGYRYDDGYSRYDHGYSYSSGYGYGYSHYTSRRYHPRPVVVIQYGDPWFNCRPVSPVVIYRPRPYCPPPVVVCPMPRPSGFSFHVRF